MIFLIFKIKISKIITYLHVIIKVKKEKNMYSKEELLIFSIINSKYDISTQNLINKIFKFSNKENLNFCNLNRENKEKLQLEKELKDVNALK